MRHNYWRGKLISTKFGGMVLLGFLPFACHNNKPGVIFIDGVPHEMTYTDCEACERKGYFVVTCSKCGGTGQAQQMCFVCLGTKTAVMDTAGGVAGQPCTNCQQTGNVTVACPVEERVNCRPCKGTGRKEVGYKPVQGVDW